MPNAVSFHCDGNDLFDADGRRFDGAAAAFVGEARDIDPAWKKLGARDAVAWLQRQPCRIRPPVAVIGPREATEAQRQTAYAIGLDLAGAGLGVICGGRQGVMEAVCKGVHDGGGVSVGLLPDGDWRTANPYVTIPVATGIGIARNALISRAAHAMIAVGAGLGTISEMALGLQFNKIVFAVHDRIAVEGVRTYPDWESMSPHFYEAVLTLG